jgi:hypothetical protein
MIGGLQETFRVDSWTQTDSSVSTDVNIPISEPDAVAIGSVPRRSASWVDEYGTGSGSDLVRLSAVSVWPVATAPGSDFALLSAPGLLLRRFRAKEI